MPPARRTGRTARDPSFTTGAGVLPLSARTLNGIALAPGRAVKNFLALTASVVALLSSLSAQAQETLPALPPAAPPAPNAAPQPVVTRVDAAPGSGGLTVITPVAGGGTMTAVGCSAVTVQGHSTEVRAGGQALAMGAPCVAAAVAPQERYAPDGGRKAALIAAPIVYGVGMAYSGMSYLINSGHSRTRSDATAALVGYTTISTIVPSIPRLVVGDTTRGLVYSAARGASIGVAIGVDWGKKDDDLMGPFLFGFAAPLALAIVDMATTPHREDLVDSSSDTPSEPKASRDGARITGISPVALRDQEGKTRGGAVTLGGAF